MRKKRAGGAMSGRRQAHLLGIFPIRLPKIVKVCEAAENSVVYVFLPTTSRYSTQHGNWPSARGYGYAEPTAMR